MVELVQQQLVYVQENQQLLFHFLVINFFGEILLRKVALVLVHYLENL
jgi:hypothetical protein